MRQLLCTHIKHILAPLEGVSILTIHFQACLSLSFFDKFVVGKTCFAVLGVFIRNYVLLNYYIDCYVLNAEHLLECIDFVQGFTFCIILCIVFSELLRSQPY